RPRRVGGGVRERVADRPWSKVHSRALRLLPTDSTAHSASSGAVAVDSGNQPELGGGMVERPLALDAYEQLADAYASRVDTKDYNAHYERPAMLSLLPDVRGLRALDAGCGRGRYAEGLADQGADVRAVELSPRMLANARRRLGLKARIEKADLNHP